MAHSRNSRNSNRYYQSINRDSTPNSLINRLRNVLRNNPRLFGFIFGGLVSPITILMVGYIAPGTSAGLISIAEYGLRAAIGLGSIAVLGAGMYGNSENFILKLLMFGAGFAGFFLSSFYFHPNFGLADAMVVDAVLGYIVAGSLGACTMSMVDISNRSNSNNSQVAHIEDVTDEPSLNSAPSSSVIVAQGLNISNFATTQTESKKEDNIQVESSNQDEIPYVAILVGTNTPNPIDTAREDSQETCSITPGFSS